MGNTDTEVTLPAKGSSRPDPGRLIGLPLYLNSKDASAEGMLSATGFIVKANSEIVTRPTASFNRSKGLADLRARLVRDGSLVQAGQMLRFKADYEFGSASTAASIVRGCPANGLATWRTKDGVQLGALLKDISEKATE